jgi:hypothetical protein
VSKEFNDKLNVQSGSKDDVLLIRLFFIQSIDQEPSIEKIANLLERVQCQSFKRCMVQAIKKTDMTQAWKHTFDLPQGETDEDDIFPSVSLETASNETYSDDSVPRQVLGDTSAENKWKVPGSYLGGLRKLGGQVSEQALRIAQDTATTTQEATFKATEQTMRSAINQTMNAFQIAVEEIHARKLPAKMTALTGTINVGVIQLSIRLDIPMDEETGEISIETKQSNE